MKTCQNKECGMWRQEEKFPDAMNFCSICGTELIKDLTPIEYILYVHSDKESMFEQGVDLGLSDKALEQFRYVGYEVGLEIIIDPETGKAKMIGVMDHGSVIKLERPVEV